MAKDRLRGERRGGPKSESPTAETSGEEQRVTYRYTIV